MNYCIYSVSNSNNSAFLKHGQNCRLNFPFSLYIYVSSCLINKDDFTLL